MRLIAVLSLLVAGCIGTFATALLGWPTFFFVLLALSGVVGLLMSIYCVAFIEPNDAMHQSDSTYPTPDTTTMTWDESPNRLDPAARDNPSIDLEWTEAELSHSS